LTKRASGKLLLFSALILATAFACGDDGGSGGRGQGGEDTSTTTGTGTGSTTSTSSSPTTTTTTGAGGAGGGGGQGGQGGSIPGDNGAQSTEFVSAGEVVTSQNYRLVFTMGQPTQNQETMTSPNHRLIGGFVGATGSP
jgi:hypothetical protein